MTVEEGEEVFNKRWNYWTEQEMAEFCSVIEVADLGSPAILCWALNHPELISESVHDHLDELRNRRGVENG